MTNQIAAYLDELDAALTVDRRQRRRIVDETRDHLAEAVGRHEAEGLSSTDAEVAALEAFGPVAVVARGFDPPPSAVGVGAAVYVHLALLAGAALVTIGLSGAFGGALGLAFGPEFVSGTAPATIEAAECTQLAASEPGATSCASAWSWHHLEETILYRGLPGVLGIVVVAIHLLVARWYLPRTGWALRMTRWTVLAGIVAFGAAALAFGSAYTILDAESVPLGPSQVGDGWWSSLHYACATMFGAGLVAYAVARRRPLLNG